MPRKTKNKHPLMHDTSDPKSLICQTFSRMEMPSGDFDPNGNWTHVYSDISSLSFNHIQGQVTLRHRPKNQLAIESYRNCPSKYRYYTQARVICGSDTLLSPSKWRVESKVAKAADDKAYLNSGMTKEVSAVNGTVTIRTGQSERKVPLDGAFTCKWCLMDVVGRLAMNKVKSVAFTMFDEYDEPMPNQVLTLRGKERVKTKSGDVGLTTYQHTGTGTVPGVYYVDPAGRVVAYLAGMELLALKKAAGKGTGIK